ncbi:hypothetical protein JCM10908_006931 [Rhodotorula pacifica]|uniref:uncharacterized protein n=1 Tax=Rhodotorula pacifica TaxID=1495444 RepID=UPI003173F76D
MQEYSPYPGNESAAELVMPGGFSRNTPTRAIHSHNDYWRDVPLYSALSYGVLSVEADVWLNPDDGVLYISHDVAALTPARTFKKLYVDQLVRVLELANPTDEQAGLYNNTYPYSATNVKSPRTPWTGYFMQDSSAPIQLLVDLKTRGNETYHAVLKELAPLRERGWLLIWNGTAVVPGPVKVVLTGNGATADVLAQVAPQTRRDVFIDAPLLQLNQTWTGVDGKTYGWNSTLSPVASTNFAVATNWTARFEITAAESAPLTQIIASAQARGFTTRFWNTPSWPIHVRNRVWETLYNLKNDWLNADDLAAAAAF